MPTRQSVHDFGTDLTKAIAAVAFKHQQKQFEDKLAEQMQPQTTQQSQPVPQVGTGQGMPSPDAIANGSWNTTNTVQPNLLQVLAKLSQSPDNAQFVNPMIQQQAALAQAAKAPWMEQTPGQVATNVITGETKTAPFKPTATQDKKISERIGSDNIKYATMQRADNTTYEIPVGNERQAAQGILGSAQGFDPDAIAKAMKEGTLPPTMEGLSRGQGGVVQSKLAKLGLNYSMLNQDWKATSRHFQTLNGTQQTRLRQAATTARESLDIIDQLAEQWNGGKYPILNKASLTLAKQGALGEDAQKIATTLEAQITDVVSEMSNVYMGGNSPTDQALKLAAKNLSADWSKGQLKAGTDLARKNLTIRLNSIANTGAITATGNTPYGGGQFTAPQISSQDQEAIDWAKSNPNDPRAQKILQLHGVQ
jgi:hypothetical protein